MTTRIGSAPGVDDVSGGKATINGPASAISGRTRPARRPSRGRKQEIIDAAAAIFRDKGYDATSIQDIADAVGILKGSLYYYIDTKEELLFAVIQEIHEGGLADLHRWRDSDADPLVRLRGFVETHVLHLAENYVKAAVFFHDFRSLDGPRRDVILSERDEYDSSLREIIRSGQEAGVICPDVDAKLAAFGVLGLMNWIYHWYRPDGGLSAKAIASGLADIAVAGLACSEATHVPGHVRLVGALPPDADVGPYAVAKEGTVAMVRPAHSARAGSA